MNAYMALVIIAASMTAPQIIAIVILALIVVAAFVAFRFNTTLQMRVSFNMDDESKLFNKDGLEKYYINHKKQFKKASLVVVEIGNLDSAYKNHPRKQEFIIKMADAVLKGMKKEETAARISFNKFVALLNDRDQLALKQYCQNVEERITTPGFDGYTDIKYDLKFGVYESPKMEDVLGDLRLAEAAITYSTFVERNIYHYVDEVEFYAVKEVRIAKARAIAIEQKQFVPYIIPRVSVKSKKVVGGEIVCRWVDNRQEDLFLPSDFLPIFEADGFIKELDKEMFDAACLLAQSLKAKKIDDLVVAVNVSKQNFEDVNYPDSLVAIAKNYNIDNANIEIGLTGITPEDSSSAIAKYVTDLKQRGFKVAVNGFGKTPQPLSAIVSSSYDAYKLDGSFFTNGLTTDKAKKAVMDLITLVEGQEANVVCDGVSDTATMNYIASVNEDTYIQGSAISKSVPTYQFDSILSTKFVFDYKPLPKSVRGGQAPAATSEEVAQLNERIRELEEELAKERAKKKGKGSDTQEVEDPAPIPAPQPVYVNHNSAEIELLRRQLEEERERARLAEKEARDAEFKRLREEIEGLKKAKQEPIVLEAVEEEPAPAPALAPTPVPTPIKEDADDDDEDEGEEEELEEIDLEGDAEKDEEKLAKLMEGFKKQFKDQWEQEMLKKYPELMKKHNERKCFADRVIKMAPEKKEYYNTIKNALMGYEGVTNVTKNFSDNFVYNRQVIAKIAVSGKSFKLYLALDPSKYPAGQFPHQDVSAKKVHAKTPFAMRTTSKLATKRAGILIQDLAHINGMQKKKDFAPKDYAKGIQFQIKKNNKK